MDGGTKLLRGILDSFYTPGALSAALAVPKTKRELQGACRNDEWDKLYPPAGGQVKSEDLDITLLSKVLRHVCNLSTPHAGWNTLPSAADQSPSDDLVRIRIHRNEAVAHATEMKLDAAEFERIWNEISAAMIRLAKCISTDEETKWKALVEKYRTGPVTCEEEQYADDLKSWCERDRLLEDLLQDLSKKMTSVERMMVSSKQGRNKTICQNSWSDGKIPDTFSVHPDRHMARDW